MKKREFNIGSSSEKPEEKIPKFLNNFFLYLPGGPRRANYGMNPEKDRMMDAIDKLLREEFQNVNPQEIFENIGKSNGLTGRALDSETDISEEKREIMFADARELSKKADSALRPLFQKLVEMGFKEGMLMQ